ncbi:hypothetical protein ACWN8V_03405 [Vagococcus elongatus]|uniref:Uncharacterized protein n=1 Tax=Vagococcus elongatus TaxID=180344 RepID=A0A430AZH1_9ENTE|nr:hypothetical protein [Vagococcus elongatus]RSU13473.1 hypothetical protein CBF29_04265 [Vagococcus elongatus]
MENIERVFDGEHILLSNGKKIPLKKIRQVKIVVAPYLIFQVWRQKGDCFEQTLMKVIYPSSTEKGYDKEQLVQGEIRPTRSIHYFTEGSKQIKRKIDLKNPHKVKLTGHRNLILELLDGEEEKVSFDGDCMNRLEEITQIERDGAVVPVTDFFDRASYILEVIKKQGLPVSSYI